MMALNTVMYEPMLADKLAELAAVIPNSVLNDVKASVPPMKALCNKDLEDLIEW